MNPNVKAGLPRWQKAITCAVEGIKRIYSTPLLGTNQGKSPGIFPPITPKVGTFWGKTSLKVLSNKVFRFIQQTLFTLYFLPHHPMVIRYGTFLQIIDWLSQGIHLIQIRDKWANQSCLRQEFLSPPFRTTPKQMFKKSHNRPTTH